MLRTSYKYSLEGYGECWNPTEAGGRSDGTGMDTKTILESVHAGKNVLSTVLQPAYWLRANDTEENPNAAAEFCPPGTESFNTVDTHPYDFTKVVTVGCFAMDNCIGDHS